jgi:hypothetical protein
MAGQQLAQGRNKNRKTRAKHDNSQRKKKSCLARNRVGVDNKHQVSPDDFGMPHVVAIGRANSLKEGGINESAWVWRKK